MLTEPTWADVDNIVNMRDKKTDRAKSLADLEIAIAKDDKTEIRSILSATKGPTEDYVCDVYIFSGVRLTLEIQERRIKKWHKEGQLCNSLYTSAVAKSKEAKKEYEKKKESKEYKEYERIEEYKEYEKFKEAHEKSVEYEKSKKESEEEERPKKPEKKKKKAPKRPSMKIGEKVVFNRLQKNDDLMAYVPSKDDKYVYPTWTLEFVTMLDHGMNCWLYGGTGAGKSSLVEQVCAEGELPLMYQSFHEDLKPDQLIGGKDLVDGNTVWVDGPVTRAYREGFVLLLDEMDAFPPEVQFCLFGILDRKPLVLAENGNEVVNPHPNFRVVATGNTQGRGDETGMYAGTNVLNRALLNRFRPWYHVEYPTESVYKDVIKKEGVREDVAKVMARLAKELNSAFLNGTLTETFSLRDARQVSSVAELVDGDVGRALEICLLNRLSSHEKSAVAEMFRRIVPDEM